MNQINIAPEGENSRGFEDIQIFQGFSPPCIKARGKGPRDKFGEFVQFRLKMLLYKFGHPPNYVCWFKHAAKMFSPTASKFSKGKLIKDI